MEKYVVRLEISVHDVVLVQYLEGFEELFENQEGGLFREFSLSGKQTLQSTSIAVLVNEVKIIGCFEHVEVADDVLVDFNVGEDVDFIYRALLEFFILSELGDGNYLDCVLLLVVVIDCTVDFSVDSWTDGFIQGVVLDVFDHQTVIMNLRLLFLIF